MAMTPETLHALVGARDEAGIRAACENRGYAAIASALSELVPEEARYVLLALPRYRAGKVLAHAWKELVVELLAASEIERLSAILNAMESDDLTDVFQHLGAGTRTEVLRVLEEERAGVVRKLIAYEEGTVGSRMRTEFLRLPAGITAEGAFKELRRRGPSPSRFEQIHLVDARGRLKAVATISDAIMCDPALPLLNFANQNPRTVRPDESIEEAVRLVREHDVPVLPVVDGAGELAGVVTSDDILDAEVQEATMDFHKMAPVGLKGKSLSTASTRDLVIARSPWLVVLVFMNIFSGAGIAHFEDTIEAVVALVFFLPLLIDSGGNAGSQAATLMVRALATADVKIRDWTRLFLKEIGVALVLGLLMATAVASVALFRAPEIMVPVALTMVCTVLFGSLVGMSLPFLLTKLKLDPATASAPLITSIADIGGVLIYFSIATVYLGPAIAAAAAAAG